jgi:hypothetical protein
VTPIYKLSDNSILNGRIIYSSMLAGNPPYAPPSLTVDYLVLAGGAGGGSYVGGGGGAGGLRSTVTATGGGGSLESPLVLDLDEIYTVTVGAGGAGGVGGVNDYGSNGNDSIFSTITSTKGGGGASFAGTYAGNNGGCGGGGSAFGSAPGGTGNNKSGICWRFFYS